MDHDVAACQPNHSAGRKRHFLPMGWVVRLSVVDEPEFRLIIRSYNVGEDMDASRRINAVLVAKSKLLDAQFNRVEQPNVLAPRFQGRGVGLAGQLGMPVLKVCKDVFDHAQRPVKLPCGGRNTNFFSEYRAAVFSGL